MKFYPNLCKRCEEKGKKNSELRIRAIAFRDFGCDRDIGMNWTNTIHHPAKAGSGLEEVDYETILSTIVNSI